MYSGQERLVDQLTYANSTQTADGKYMYDMTPWKITAFNGGDEVVTVPKDIKAWYGSPPAAPTASWAMPCRRARTPRKRWWCPPGAT